MRLSKSNIMSGLNNTILSIAQVTIRHFEKILFESLSMEIKGGEQWAILGRSGSGKSALLQTMLGRFNIINGGIKYPYFDEYKKAHDITDPLFTHHRLISFVGQQAQFKNKENMKSFFYQQRYHAWFAEEAVNVEEYLQAQQKKNIKNGVVDIRFSPQWIIEHLQLEPLLQKTLIQLSNGETRRLMIAHALLEQPLLLLMDSPFLGLDTATRPILNKLLEEIVHKGTHLLIATTPGEIPDCVTHVMLLDKQQIQYAGRKEDFQKIDFDVSTTSEWEPNSEILSKLNNLKPLQNHDFIHALLMENIKVKYGDNYILQDINWTVAKGEKWALLGSNGAGKSTLLSLINGDHPQSYSNNIKLFDKKKGSGESIWELKRRIGFVSPELHQYFQGNNDTLTVILSGLEDTMGFRTKDAKAEENQLARLWLELLELGHLAEVKFQDMAAGDQRLVLLLRSLIKNPALLILDEPCQGLDSTQKNHFIRVIDKLWNVPDKTLLYVSHYKEDIPSCVKQVLTLEKGRVVQER